MVFYSLLKSWAFRVLAVMKSDSSIIALNGVFLSWFWSFWVSNWGLMFRLEAKL